MKRITCEHVSSCIDIEEQIHLKPGLQSVTIWDGMPYRHFPGKPPWNHTIAVGLCRRANTDHNACKSSNVISNWDEDQGQGQRLSAVFAEFRYVIISILLPAAPAITRTATLNTECIINRLSAGLGPDAQHTWPLDKYGEHPPPKQGRDIKAREGWTRRREKGTEWGEGNWQDSTAALSSIVPALLPWKGSDVSWLHLAIQV